MTQYFKVVAKPHDDVVYAPDKDGISQLIEVGAKFPASQMLFQYNATGLIKIAPCEAPEEVEQPAKSKKAPSKEPVTE